MGLLGTPVLAFTLDCTSGSGSYSGTSSEMGEVILPKGGAVTMMQSGAKSFTVRLDGRTFDGGAEMGVARACQKAAAAGPTAQQIATAQAQVTTAAQASAAGQTGAAASAVGAAIGTSLGGGSGATVSTKGFFLSTQGVAGRADADWNAWVALGRRTLDGAGTSGSSTSLTLGVDRKIGSRALLGVVLSGDDLTLDQGAVSSGTRTFVGGPYFAAELGPVQVDGFIARGRADVSGALGTFRASRTLGAVNVKYGYDLGGWTITPFASLRGSRDEEPARVVGIVPIAARSVQSVTGAVGGTFAYDMALGRQSITPYVTLAAERTTVQDGFGGTSSFNAPRVSLGVASIGPLGDLAFAVDGGKLSVGLRDAGVRITYTLKF